MPDEFGEDYHVSIKGHDAVIDADAVPVAAGAYALMVRLSRPWSPGITRLSDRMLDAGYYIYCGSAYGPGGLRARIARHLRSGKRAHWHIDRLTEVGTVVDVAVHIAGDECNLVDALVKRGASTALAGFGSSDCRRCPAHLLSPPQGFDRTWLAADVGLGRNALPSL